MKISQVAAAVALSASLPLPAAPAAAQSRRLISFWVIEPAPHPVGVRHLAGKDEVVRQRLLPSGLAELARVWSDPEVGELPAGMQLIEASSDSGAVYCEGDIRHADPRGLLCFLDSDRDGRFDSRFKTASSTPALVMLSGKMPKAPKPLAEPLDYRVVSPKTSRIPAFVAIERRNYFNIYSSETFMIVFGTGDEKKRITDPVHFKSADMPKEMNILGARFTALSEKDGKMAIEVHSGMPAQPFAVMSTVTYR
ncbi:MAG TPA: hypothetical protein VFQ67_16980 [Allosphingosinicella sp.]|jgi:hypothetical protein|nr:hypothetical protein [Allosphingosinicella sp.]